MNTVPAISSSHPTPQPDDHVNETQAVIKRKQGKADPFKGQLDEVLQPALQEYGEEIKKHKLHLGKGGGRQSDPTSLSNWLNEKIKSISETEQFKTITTDKSKPWLKSLQDKFKNWRNNVFIPDCRNTFIATYADLDGTSSAPLRPGAAHSLLSALRQPATAKGLFVREHGTEIEEHSHTLLKSEPSLNNNGGGARARAITELWQAADQELYQKRVAEGGAVDVDRNRQQFRNVMFDCLKDLCTSGQLGDIELFLLVGSRSDKDGEIDISRIHASSLGGKDEKFLRRPDQNEFSDLLHIAWKEFVARKIPPNVKKLQLCDGLEYDVQDIARISTSVKVSSIAPDVLAEVLETMFQALYFKVRGSPNVPYDDIKANPSTYYDTAQHNHLSTYSSLNPKCLGFGELYDMAQYLQGLQHPFMFSPSEVSGPEPAVAKVSGMAPSATGDATESPDLPATTDYSVSPSTNTSTLAATNASPLSPTTKLFPALPPPAADDSSITQANHVPSSNPKADTHSQLLPATMTAEVHEDINVAPATHELGVDEDNALSPCSELSELVEHDLITAPLDEEQPGNAHLVAIVDSHGVKRAIQSSSDDREASAPVSKRRKGDPVQNSEEDSRTRKGDGVRGSGRRNKWANIGQREKSTRLSRRAEAGVAEEKTVVRKGGRGSAKGSGTRR
ncbi:hypothetical protein VNI00_016513 [Paramarasmius palmivorus]|uniref:Uncharacterized protein n=1 Tax=Paramarasmius palmivorus TaxID=297713 RepID=A0AAW0BDV8_9AGAR